MYLEKQRDIDNIQHHFFTKVKITEPTYPGKVHDIYIVESNDKKYVFRFSNKECALKNEKISKILLKYGIPVPDIDVCKIGTKHCETYPFIEGKTLYERNLEGNLSESKLETIYKQLYMICYRMAKIPVQEFFMFNFPLTTTDVLFQTMNFAPRVIGHNDLHDKNILLNDHDNVCGILDLDAISFKPFIWFLIRLFQNANKYGYSIEKMKDFDFHTYNNGHLLTASNQVKIHQTLRSFFYKNIMPLKTKGK